MPFRIDSHQSFSIAHPGGHLAPVLERNRFAGSVAVVDARDDAATVAFEFVRAIVVRAGNGAPVDRWRKDARFRGVLWDGLGASVDDLAPADTLDVRVAPADLDEVARIAERSPGRKIALVHLGCPNVAGDPAPWARAIERLGALPNVYCKASGLTRLAAGAWRGDALGPFLHRVLRSFGPERVMFGSGWPECLPEYAWKETLAAFTQALGAAPVALREQLLGATAARFYAIQEPASGVI